MQVLQKQSFKFHSLLKKTPLTERALVVLIADASGVTKTDIKYVLNAMRRLQTEYIKE